uniref:Cytochrome P450 n=1 Tax=Anopheles maculatus TaxID=74869 RepID=A0A182SJW1_9DIPT
FTYKLLTRHRSYFRRLRVPFERPHFLYGNLDDVLSGKLTTMEKIEQFYRKFASHGCCAALIDFIASRAELELEVKAIFLKHTLNMFAGIAFGKELNTFQDDTDRFCAVASGMAYGTNPVQVIKTMAFYLAPGLMRSIGVQFTDRQEIDYLVKQFHSTASDSSTNSMGRFLKQANDKLKTSQQLSDEQLTAQCAIFFTKGFEPTLNLLSFAAYELAQNLHVQQKLYDELTTNGLTNGSAGLTPYERIRSLPYLDAIVQETLRKWPPHPLLVRECTKPFIIAATENGDRASIPLKVGDKLYLSVWAMHRNGDYFPQPEQFRPERFEDGQVAKVAHSNTFIPFGIGRGCVGQQFVKLVVKLTLVALVQRFKLQPGERTPEPLKLIESASSLEARDGFWIRMEPRVA